MKNHNINFSGIRAPLRMIALATCLALPLPTMAATVELATSPLATATTTKVKPNMLLVLDNSGSMEWDHMPDDASDGGSSVAFSFGYYGLRSSQCNEVYYDPTTIYLAPVKADGTDFLDASFTGAWTNGFNTGAGTVNLQTSFIASQSLSADASGSTAYYYNYSGAQTDSLQHNYNKLPNTFANECSSAQSVAPGKDVFTKIVLSNAAAANTATIVASCSSCSNTTVSSIKINGVELMSSSPAPAIATNSPTAMATALAAKISLAGYSASASGSTVTITGLMATDSSLIVTQSGDMTFSRTIYPKTDAAKLTNFANWYSYYRTRMLMMKTATGRAFSNLNENYRVGLMKISASTAPSIKLDTFWDNTDTMLGPVSTQRTNWYTALYGVTTSGSTPLRTALSNAGRYFAGKLSTTDPTQYSCQQNFAILTTDGYWNSGDSMMLDGSTQVGNQDGNASRPMFDGAVPANTKTTTYTRNSYTTSATGIGKDASCPAPAKKAKQTVRLLSQPQQQTCSVTGTAAPVCSAWSNSGSQVYVAPFSSNTATCATPVALPSPNPSAAVATGTTTSVTASGGSTNSLADVAMYYYQTDLRTTALGNCGSTSNDLCANNVLSSLTDKNTQQHMTTFTLGLGASGWMEYQSSYLTDTSGDFASVNLGLPADSKAVPPICSWQADGTACNWPLPGMTGSDGLIANIDDLWHAAVDGHGAYFSATNPTTLASGLNNALAGIQVQEGAAAAAATSTLNPVSGNNFAYVASYTTSTWKGNLEERGINTDTGAVTEHAIWCVENVPADTCKAPSTVTVTTTGSTTEYYCVTPNVVTCAGGMMINKECHIPIATTCNGTMPNKVADMTDTRSIVTPNSSGTTLIDFDAAFASGNSNFSSTHISGLSQWAALTAAQKTAAAGVNLINYLRGQYGYEERTSNPTDNWLYRKREATLGDALESQPAYMAEPVFSYPYPGYSTYKSNQAGRDGTVFMGTNDGMLHAFASLDGIERWAYVPSMVIPNMWQLADINYANSHINFVNGSVTTSDICSSSCGSGAAVWKTILVGGLNGGGRGYYALDITVPTAPVLLWEFTTSSGIGKVKDDDLGYSFSQPVIARKADGTWVVIVTSGYNNVSPGSGRGFLYVLDAATGVIISKIDTGAGSTTTPSGLGKISVWNDEPIGNKAGFVYGGDLQGNLWRFDINSSSTATIGNGAFLKFAVLQGPSGSAQPITTSPVLGEINSKRVIFIGTGKYLETSDLTTTQVQTQYAIEDDNATTTLVNPRASLVNQTLANNPDGTATRVSSSNAVDFNKGRGWYVDFPDIGERVNIDAQLVQGTLLVPTIVPSNTVCTPGGYGWLNFFDYLTGGTITNSPISGVKYDSTIVGINVVYVQGKAKVSVVTSANPTPKLNSDVGFKDFETGFTGKRTLWRELIQ